MFRDRKKIKPLSIDIDIFANMPDGVPLNVTTIKHPAFNEYNQVWRDVPQDILYKYLADNNHPDWNITLPASLEEYVELTKSNPLLKGILHTLVLDIEIYRQDISQDIFKLRIQQRRNKIAIWEQLVEDGLLLDFANTNSIEMNSFIRIHKVLLDIHINIHTTKLSDEALLTPTINSVIDMIRGGLKQNLTDSVLTTFEILKKLNYKDFATADTSKRKKSMMVTFNKYYKKYIKEMDMGFTPIYKDILAEGKILDKRSEEALKKVDILIQSDSIAEEEKVGLKELRDALLEQMSSTKKSGKPVEADLKRILNP